MNNETTLTTHHLWELLEDRRVEEETRIVKVYDRIDEMKKDLHEEIEKSHTEIMNSISDMRQEMKRHTDDECEMLDRLDKRVAEIEKWRWLVVGGAAVAALIVFGGIESFMDIMK